MDEDTTETHKMSMTDDMLNAVIFGFIEGFSNRVREDSEWLNEELDDDDNPPFEIPIDSRGIKVFSIYNLTLSYIEACAALLLHDTISRGLEPECTELLAYARQDRQYSRYADGSDSKENELWELLEYLYSRRCSLNDYKRLLGGAGILDSDLLDRIDTVQELRGQFIHSPQTLINLRTGAEVKEAANDCVEVLDELEEFSRNRLDLHEYYHHLTDYNHNN